jgi:hypothetical protein
MQLFIEAKQEAPGRCSTQQEQTNMCIFEQKLYSILINNASFHSYKASGAKEVQYVHNKNKEIKEIM